MTALGVEAAYSLCCGGSLADVGVRDLSVVVASVRHGTVHASSALSAVVRTARGYGVQEVVLSVPTLGVSIMGADGADGAAAGSAPSSVDQEQDLGSGSSGAARYLTHFIFALVVCVCVWRSGLKGAQGVKPLPWLSLCG